ncbi:hypothetical protein P171DRAFT_482886 [Karstenula rhodostoma CBS 690.94]|uniref:Uncharacterized protein n=1 Tax=Karstenula rhodostoma CBS 690.94 TaxID=1392251 RepID=A0A9P4PMN9_9PLEO|nr:hypothetical protein P171DRAFT_482886 [Karstenula rhodostoma CBS 690.94]
MYASRHPQDEPYDKNIQDELLQEMLGMNPYSRAADPKSQPMPPMQPASPIYVFALQVDLQPKPRSHSAPASRIEIQSIPAPDCQPESRGRSAPPAQPSLLSNLSQQSQPGPENNPSYIDISPQNVPLLQHQSDLVVPSASYLNISSASGLRISLASDLNLPSVSDLNNTSASQKTLVSEGQSTPPAQSVIPSAQGQPDRQPSLANSGSSSMPTLFDVEDPAPRPGCWRRFGKGLCRGCFGKLDW